MKEYFDIVDKNDKVIGRALRSECHSNPKLIHRGVFVIVINEGKILLQRRGMKADTNPGKWEFMGEHNKVGESYRKAAIRGLKEELGINQKVKKIAKMKISSRRETEFDEIYICKVSGKIRINFNKKEVKEVKSFTPKEIERLMKKNPRMFSSWSVKVLNNCKSVLSNDYF